MDHPNPENALSLTLSRQEWLLIVFLATRGAQRQLEEFVNGQAHDLHCVSDAAAAVKKLQDLFANSCLTQ